MIKKLSKLLLAFVVGISLVYTNVFADNKNDVTLNFAGGVIHDGYVEYTNVGKIQLFKGEDLVADISNNMVIDLNEAEYKFVIEEIEDSSIASTNKSIKLKINKWYYPITAINETKSTFKLDSSKFNGTLDIEFEKSNIAYNTTVKNIYNDISSNGVIDLTNGQEYIIDFSKTDQLTEGLKSFADLDETLYYKKDNNGLLKTDNESEAVIKIVGNKAENKAILIVDESYDVVVGLSNPKNIERDDFFIKMKFKILSNAPINEMKITGLSIKGMSYPGSENEKIIQDYESERNVNFQYEDKGNVIINFDIKDEQLQNMFEKFNCIELRIDMEVLCNNVETKVVVDTLFDVDKYIGCKDGITCKECKIRNSNTFCNNAYLC